VSQALAEAHAVGVIHRDVKPANIFLHKDGVKLVDFGIAKLGEETGVDQATTMGRLLGTPVYMSPERLLGHAYDGGADVYALAVTIYQTLAGKLPFTIAPSAGLGAIIVTCLHEPPEPLATSRPGVPPAIADLVMRGLDKDRARRPTMAELAAGLAEAVGLPAPPPPAATRAADPTTLDSPLARGA
jgi:serine/threonine protein kinase